MRSISTFFVLTTAVVGFSGCGQIPGWPSTSKSSAHGGMAVVDLDKVAVETGRDRLLAQAIKIEENSLNQQLTKIKENAQEQLETKKKNYGEDMSESDKKEFSDWIANARNQLAQVENQARAKYQQYIESQKAQFRLDVKPIAQEIASKRGLGIVVPKNEGLLLAIDPGLDITDEVVKVLREKHPIPPVAPAQPAQTADADAPPAKTSASTKSSSSAKPAARTRAAKSDDDSSSTR